MHFDKPHPWLNKEKRAILADILQEYCHDGVDFTDESILNAWERGLESTKNNLLKITIGVGYSASGEKIVRYF